VQRGHTIEAIAHRYHVSVKAILEANHLKHTKHLQVGQTLMDGGEPCTRTG
jgi:LysM repeat protein